MSKNLRKEDLEPLLIGFGILGTGGGGDPAWGREILLNDWECGRDYVIVSPDEVDDDAIICSGGIMGSVKYFESLSCREIVEMWEHDFILETSLKLMEHHLGRKVDYVLPFEIGGVNTPVIMTLAARINIPVVDADLVGRAAPETQMTSCIGLGVDLYPMPVVDSMGNKLIVQKGITSTYADEIGRIMIGMGSNYAANTHYPMSGKDLKRTCIPGTISDCIGVGKAILDAEAHNEDPVAAFTNYVDGIRLFRGKVTSLRGEEKVGFYATACSLEGVADYLGRKAKLVIKNESMALWVDGEIKAIFPDLACMLHSKNGRGILSNQIVEGLDMTIVGVKAHENLRKCLETEVGKAAHSGARYGYPALEFIPIEKLNPR